MKLASLFQNHAVLQRHVSLPVWGTAQPGEKIVVHFAGRESSAIADAEGRWMLHLPPMPEGGPYTLEAESPSARVTLDDLMVGEVWICSGQSNMERPLNHVGGEVDLPTLPHVRLFTASNPAESGRAEQVEGRWETGTPEALAKFSAVAGYFGRRLHEVIRMPIGLICNAKGATRVQAWISREGLAQEPEGRDELRFYDAQAWQQDGFGTRTFREWELNEAPKDQENAGLPKGWASPEFEDAAWPAMQLPALWQQRGHEENGVFWFRRSVELPEAWHGQALELSLGVIDKRDEVWVNGCLVGATGLETENAWTILRHYPVPAGWSAVKGGVRIAVRVVSHVYAGGFAGPEEAMWIAPAGAAPKERIPLGGTWAYQVEQNWGKVPPPRMAWGSGNPNTPAILFESRIAPLIPYAFRGVIWYQGEGNTSEADLYRRLIVRLIRDWRFHWGAGAFPFLQVQLANFLPPDGPNDNRWAALREAQTAALALENTGLAVTIDIGEADDVHPRNKRDVGLRLARNALHYVYGRESVPMGPLFTGMNLEPNGRLRCFFRHTAGGLVARGGKLRQFAVAGYDRIFHPAHAEIEGDTVVAFSPEVKAPYAVRYAWANDPEGCNLYNDLDLPASPFRSDSWPAEGGN